MIVPDKNMPVVVPACHPMAESQPTHPQTKDYQTEIEERTCQPARKLRVPRRGEKRHPMILTTRCWVSFIFGSAEQVLVMEYHLTLKPSPPGKRKLLKRLERRR